MTTDDARQIHSPTEEDYRHALDTLQRKTSETYDRNNPCSSCGVELRDCLGLAPQRCCEICPQGDSHGLVRHGVMR